MRIAVIADVHANLGAARAVLQQIDRFGVDEILCLGDTIGYNAQPVECIDLVLGRSTSVLAGNHDVDVATGRRVAGTNQVASLVQDWTRDQLDRRRIDLLDELQQTIEHENLYIARHGAFLGGDPTNGYVTSTMLEENLVAIRGDHGAVVAFCGHTHVPMIGWLEDDHCVEPPIHGIEITWPRTAGPVLINPGAVGQPRDRNPRAAFAIVDFVRRTVAWHRVPYDIASTADAILRNGLPSVLLDRIVEGR